MEWLLWLALWVSFFALLMVCTIRFKWIRKDDDFESIWYIVWMLVGTGASSAFLVFWPVLLLVVFATCLGVSIIFGGLKYLTYLLDKSRDKL